MKIWEKNYILAMGLLLLLLFGGMFFLQQYSFCKNIRSYCERALFNESRTEYEISSLLTEQDGEAGLERYCQRLKKQKVYLRVESQGRVFSDTRPFLWESSGKEFLITESPQGVFACISNVFEDAARGEIHILYMEQMDGFYRVWKKQSVMFIGVAVLIGAALSAFLYGAMKKIYSPMNRIAHELRAPLTVVRGYSQYIQLGNISPEDAAFASRQIDMEVGHMDSLIESLMVMGSLREGSIKMGRVKTEELAGELGRYFPFLEIVQQAEYLYGEKVLLISLLRNLISNTCRRGEQVRLYIQKNGFVVYNKDDYLDKELLGILNRNRPIPPERVEGKGLGVPLCREIVKMHHGTLKYRNVPEGGVEISAVLKGV